MDSWLPVWADQYGIIGIGVVAVIMGISGLVRRESGALSHDERHTPLGRMLTPLLSGIWLIIGALLLVTRRMDEPMRSETVGFTAIIGSITVLSTLILALIYYALPLPNKRPASLETTSSLHAAVSTHEPRFRRHDTVLHPEYGRGRVLGCYAHDSLEMVAVRFPDAILSVPAASLTQFPPQ